MTEVEVQSDGVTPHKRRTVTVIVIIAVLILGGIALCSRRGSAATDAAGGAGGKGGGRGTGGPVPVAVAPVQEANVPVYLQGLGNVTGYHTVTVRTRIDGQLLQVNFAEGQLVHKGQELALVDPRPYQAALAQTEAKRFQDAAQLENVQRDLRRYADLYRDGVLPQQQYNSQQSLVTVTQGQIKSDEAQIETAKLNVAYCHITAPISGRIGLRSVDPGNMVHASDANGLFTITEVQPIAVIFSIPEDQVTEIMQQMHVHPLPVEAWSKDNSQRIATGRLETVDNQIDPNTGTVRLKAVFDNNDSALYPNQFVNAKLLLKVLQGALTVPGTAVQQGVQGQYVYVVKPDMTVESRPITVTLTQGQLAVIGSGLNLGDRVVIDGQDKLQPGSKIEIAQPGGGGGRGNAGGQGHERRRGA